MKPLIIDCDTGNDDAVALVMALSAPERFNLLGIMTVSGNATLENVHINTRKVCELVGRSDVGVYAGCPRPLMREAVRADGAHGATGLDGVNLPAPKTPVQTEHAVDFMIRALHASPEKVTLVITGAMTNAALAIVKDPSILDKLEQIVFMGGSTTAGNITPAAEFNMYSDPHAAHIVLTCGVPQVMFGLNVTHQVLFTPDWEIRYRAAGRIGSAIADALSHAVDFDRIHFDLAGRAVHDACTIAYLLKPDLFTCRRARVHVNTTDEMFMGSTNVSFYPAHVKDSNIFVADAIDEEGVCTLILECLEKIEGLAKVS